MAFNRDGLGRFAAAENSTGGNGGGANFAPPAQLPETRQALLRYATSRPSRAPQMQSGGLPEFPSPMDSHEQAYNAVMGGREGGDITQPIREAANAFNDAGEHSALRSMGYGGPEHPGASDVASQFVPHMDFGGIPND